MLIQIISYNNNNSKDVVLINKQLCN